MKLHDAGDFTPTATLPPYRYEGVQYPGRLSTTDEQRQEAKHWLADQALRAGSTGARATVHWTRYPAGTLEVHGHVEHVALPTGVEALFAVDRVIERDAAGAVIPRDEQARLARLKTELRLMREHDAGPTEES